MMLKLSTKEIADYVELINSYLDKTPCLDVADFDTLISLLSSPTDDNDTVEVPEHLRDYVENIRELIQSPEDFASNGHHHVFIDKVRQRKKAKVDELSAMPREERMHLIAQSMMDEMERHLGQIELQRKQLPREFLELPCPDLLVQLSAEQLAAIDIYTRELLENANLRRLVYCGKLSLDKLLKTKLYEGKFLLDNAMLNLLISGIINEDLFYSLDNIQRSTLAEDHFIFELMKCGAIKFDKVISLDSCETSILSTPIISCCIKLNILTIDEALQIPITKLGNLRDNQDKILTREMTVPEALNQRPVYKFI